MTTRRRVQCEGDARSVAYLLYGRRQTGVQSDLVTSELNQRTYIVTVALAVFAFTTILGWSYYGERCWQFLFSENSLMIYRGLGVLAALTFANMKVAFVWNLSDTLNGLIAVPNLLDLLLLVPMVFKVTREYFDEAGATSPPGEIRSNSGASKRVSVALSSVTQSSNGSIRPC